MLNELKKIGVFIKRDFKILFTYRLAFSTAFISIIFNLFYLVLFGSMFGRRELAALAPYGGDFISYILVGSIGWGFLWSIMSTTSASLRSEMMMGTLESIMLTPTRISTLMLAYTIFGCMFGLLSVGILISVGFLCFGVSLASATVYTFIVFFLSVLLMMGFGMIFSGLTLWAKNVGHIIPLIQNVAMFFCGVYFPITVLPTYLQPVAKYVPFYYSIEGLRKSLIPAMPDLEIVRYIIILLVWSVAFIFIGVYTLYKGLKKAKKDGSLAFY